MSVKQESANATLWGRFFRPKNGVLSVTSAELGHLLLLGAGEMRHDYFYSGDYRLVDLYESTDIRSLRRLFCECFILRMFAAHVACVTYPGLRDQNRSKPILDEMFDSFYEYVQKEPTRVFFETMNVKNVEELKKNVVEPRWEIYRKEFNRKGNKGFHVATIFGVFIRSQPNLRDSGSEEAKDFNTKRGVVMAVRFNQMLQSVEETLNRFSISESRIERISRSLLPKKLTRFERFAAPGKSDKPRP